MNQTVEERICADIVTALKGITLAAGYNGDVTVERVGAELPNGISDRMLLVSYGEARPDPTGPIGVDQWIQTYVIDCISIDSENETAEPGVRASRLRGDVIKSLSADWQRSSLAVNQRFLTDDPNGPTASKLIGIGVSLEVTYRTVQDDPFSLPGE
jgi:hypothetical protein